MSSLALRSRRALPLLLTAACLAGFVQIHLARPAEVHAQSFCANGRCTSATVCQFKQGESCSFPDRRSCVTYQCPINES